MLISLLINLLQTNNYQGIVVTNGIFTHFIFTYICGEMQWSSVGENNAAVVGYNSGTSFYNHPLSGYASVGESISCTIETGRRQKRQSEIQPTSVLLSPPVDHNLLMMIAGCRRAVQHDEKNSTFLVKSPDQIASELDPCPCTLQQARNDIGRFVKYSDNPTCFLSGPKSVSVVTEFIKVIQQCCYNPVYG